MYVAPVFDLKATNPYYADGRCADFLIEPTLSTAARMRGAGFISKPGGDRLRVFVQLGADRKPFIAPPRPIVLGFHLRLREPAFALFTDLADVKAQPAPLFTNAGPAATGSGDLTLSSRREQASESFSVQSPAAAETFILAGHPSDRAAAADFIVSGNSAITAVKTYDAALRRISVDSRTAAADSSFSVTYPIRPSLPNDVLADVDISLDLSPTTPVSETPLTFTIPFKARQARWAYYLATTLTEPLAQFMVADVSPTGAGPPVAFPDGNRRDLSANPDQGDAIAADLAKRFPAPRHRILRFLSDSPVVCRQLPSRRIELRVAANTLFPTLPNPPSASFSALTIGEPPNARREDVLFAIISHATE